MSDQFSKLTALTWTMTLLLCWIICGIIFGAECSYAQSSRASAVAGTPEPTKLEPVQLTITTGPGLSFPGSYRIRIHQVEFGTFPPALGVTKYFPFQSFYALFGGGIGFLGQTDVGLIGAAGWDPLLFWQVGMRVEVYSYVGTKGLLYTGTGLGFSVRF